MLLLYRLIKWRNIKMVYEGTISVVEFAKSKTNHYFN
jgi:hypothetical protein